MQVLDLDKLEPKPRTLTMNGKSFLVYPAKLRKIIEIAKFRNKVKDSTDGIAIIEEAFTLLEDLVPAIKEGQIDLNIDQVWALLDFVESPDFDTEPEKKSSKKK